MPWETIIPRMSDGCGVLHYLYIVLMRIPCSRMSVVSGFIQKEFSGKKFHR
jgi:hypothetical protein